ncbi:hypothetical protein F5Y16DRAFT_37564 [Xylariaceae sp. FL0255]|nr:hypothetical protein F5Y16DRAFT_37564 [Xylariaceae sp. FL0255]
MDATFTKSLVQKTDISPYNQAIFLSQNMINQAFVNMWNLAPATDPAAPLRRFKKTYRSGDIDIELDPPTVKLMTTQDPQLYFMMNMKKGSIKVYTSTDPNDNTMETFDVTGWKYAFAVKVAKKVVERNDPRFSSAVIQAGFPPDTFSLAQLYLDLSASNQNDATQNSYGTSNWNSKSPEAQASLMSFCQQWWNSMKVAGSTIVGYSVQANKPNLGNVDAATFPPTSIDYFSYPWKDPSASNPKAVDGSGKNALCYLMMSNLRSLPSPVGIKYSGTFVKGGGLYVMNESQFWGDWLLPLLQGLNKGAEIIPDEPTGIYQPQKDPQFPYYVGMRYHVGVNKSHSTKDSYYAFTKNKAHPNQWTWSGKKKPSSKTVQGAPGHAQILTQTSITSTELTWDQGGTGVVLKGNTVFTFHAQFTRNGSNSGKPSHMDITVNWYFKMALSHVNDGGVQFARVPDAKDQTTVTVKATQGDIRWKHGFESVKKHFSSTLNDYLNNDTHQIENELLLSLRGQEKLLLPASGTFLMKNPSFNARGDLLVTLEYKNLDPPNAPWQSSRVQKSVVSTKPSVHGPVMFTAIDLPVRHELKVLSEPSIRSVAVDMMLSA